MSPPAAPLISSAPRPVDVAAIEQELAHLWGQPQATGATEDAVTRACMSNLIIFCGSASDAGVISQEVAHIVLQHPARVLLLVGDREHSSADLDAYVSAQCHLSGGGKQVCSEHVMISTGANAARRLPSVTRSLLIADLPTALWWAEIEAPPLRGELFEEFAAMANQVIYDSVGWDDAPHGVVATADWVARVQAGQTVADLAWRRLKPWRRLISQSLDPAVAPGALDAVSEVVVEHGPHALPQAWLLLGWLASRLGWRSTAGKVQPGVEVTWVFQSLHGLVRVTVRRADRGESEVQKATIMWTTGSQTTRATFAMVAPGRLAVSHGEPATAARTLAVPTCTRAALVARQLPNLGRDVQFRDTLRLARAMAAALL